MSCKPLSRNQSAYQPRKFTDLALDDPNKLLANSNQKIDVTTFIDINTNGSLTL